MADINLGNDTTINTTLNEPSGINTSVSTDTQLNASVSDINYIPGYEEAEKQRRENEIQRQANELDRIALYEDMEYKKETDYYKGEDGQPGRDGAIQYTAGTGIEITDGNVINNTQTSAEWGNITGTLADQTDLNNALNNKADSSDLERVAFSGDYEDLSNTPTIPTVNDATLTIKKNNTSVGTFTANASSNVDINITVPTTASDVGAIPTTSIGTASGVAELDANGKVPSSQLPSYVDDVIEGYYKVADGKFYKESTYTTEIPGETGKIYISVDTNKSYRWTGSGFAEISSSLALGETSSTAYRGDRGKTAYDHSQLTSGNPHNVSKSDVGLGNVGNFKAVSTEASQGLSSTEQANARTNIGAGTSSFSGSYNDLSNKPSIPTKTSDLTNDSGFVTSEVVVSTTQPSEDFELWINPNESVNVYGNYISNTYGTSTEIGYSQNYVNEALNNKTTLYESSTGTSGNITLSDDISNYSFIDVITINKDTITETYGTYRFDTSLSTFRIMGTSISTNSFYILEKKYTKGTNILTASSGRIYNSASGSASNYEAISIIKVIGYK